MKMNLSTKKKKHYADVYLMGIPRVATIYVALCQRNPMLQVEHIFHIEGTF